MHPSPAAEPSPATTGLVTLGRVTALHTAPARGELPQPRARVHALRGRGIVGDRYFDHARRLSRDPRKAVAVTLIEEEALAELAAEHGIELTAAESRRTILTRGVRLATLVDRQFRVGGAILRGVLPCEPCRHLERLTGKPVLRGLVGRGGLRAHIVASGWIAVGDRLEVERERAAPGPPTDA